MLNNFTRFLYTATITAPTFFSLGLIGVINDYDNYIKGWSDLLITRVGFGQLSFLWWAVNVSFFFMIACLIGINLFLKNQKKRVGDTISVLSYSLKDQCGTEQFISTIIPWLSLFAENTDFKVLFFCILGQCVLVAVASYNNNNYNMLCSILGYHYYEVKTENNAYILLSKHCIRNKTEIKLFSLIDGYWGIIK